MSIRTFRRVALTLAYIAAAGTGVAVLASEVVSSGPTQPPGHADRPDGDPTAPGSGDQSSQGADTVPRGSVPVRLKAGPQAVEWQSGNMAPGDVLFAPMTVTNVGAPRLRYAVTATADNADGKNLAERLRLTVNPMRAVPRHDQGPGAAQLPAPAAHTEYTCGPAAFAADSEPLYSGPIGTGTPILGDTARGSQPGDRVIHPTTTEQLCFRVAFPNGTAAEDNPYQGATTTVTFTFDAEQTAQN